MLVSVLLPTHDRLEFLRIAIESVRRQRFADWEIVVSDNESAEDVAGYVAGLAEDRIRYVRTSSFVPVTANWNNALRHSRGEYVVMLGDDDALLPGHLPAIAEFSDRFEQPDVIYSGALLFAYPGVLPEEPEGYLQSYSYAPFFDGATEPFRLPHDQALALVRDAMDFRVRYGFNMQYVAVRRAVIDELAAGGDFYRSPFPDYYAMNLLFARAGTIVVDPTARVLIGITKRSYGYFHTNRREDEARALLNNEATDPEIRRELETVLLPGTNVNTGWLLAMEALHRRLGSDELRPNYERYRRLQAIHCAQAYHLHRTISRTELRRAEVGLPPGQRALLRLGGPAAGALLRATPARARRVGGAAFDRLVGQYRRVQHPAREVGRYHDVLDILDHLRATEPTLARTP